MCDNIKSRTDKKEKVNENRIRRRLSRNSYSLRKSRQHRSADNQGRYQIIRGNETVAGNNFELSLWDIEGMLFAGDLFLFGEFQNYLAQLGRRNPWFRRRNGGYKYLIASYALHFLRPDANGQTRSGEKILCKKCQSDRFIKSGQANSKQRFCCKICGCHFTVGDFRRRDQSLT